MAAPGSSDTVIWEGNPSPCGGCGQWCQKTRYRITTQYIEKEHGICCPKIDNLQLVRVKDMQFQGGCPCCSTCSTIIVYSSDETSPILKIAGIPNGKQVFHDLRDAVTKCQSNAAIEFKA